MNLGYWHAPETSTPGEVIMTNRADPKLNGEVNKQKAYYIAPLAWASAMEAPFGQPPASYIAA